MTDDRRVPPPLRSSSENSRDGLGYAREAGADHDESPPAPRETPAPTVETRAQDPSPREIMAMLEELGSRLDRVETRLNTALSRRKPDNRARPAPAPITQPSGRADPPAPAAPTPGPSPDPELGPAPEPTAARPGPRAGSTHGLRGLMKDRRAADRVTRAPGLRTPIAPAPGVSAPSAPAPAATPGEPSSTYYATRREPTRRKRGRLLLPLLVLIALAGGGWWIMADRPSMEEIVDEAFMHLDRVFYGPADGATDTAPEDVVSDTPDDDLFESDPSAADTRTAGAGGSAGRASWTPASSSGSGAGGAGPGEGADAEPAEAQTVDAVNQGPAIEAAPRDPVGTQPLSSRDDDLAAAANLPGDAPETLQTLARRATNGDADAQHDLATAFALGQDIPQDLERAVFWYRQSAEAGIANALYNLGVLTRDGLGRDASAEEAADLFRRAAERNHPDAQLALGRMQLAGRGVDQDPVQAAGWFQAASASGEPRGALELGRLFESGLDGAADTAAAAGWYRIAAEAGNEEAEAALERLVGEERQTPQAPENAPSISDLPDAVPPTNAEPVSDSQSVARIQELLAALNYDPGPADGVMGDLTRNAIEAFQEEYSLPVTGEPSRGLIEDLEHARSLE